MISILDKLEDYLATAKDGEKYEQWAHDLVESLNNLLDGEWNGKPDTVKSAREILKEARKIYK